MSCFLIFIIVCSVEFSYIFYRLGIKLVSHSAQVCFFQNLNRNQFFFSNIFLLYCIGLYYSELLCNPTLTVCSKTVLN